MARSTSADSPPPKVGAKRKGTRSVSTLTPTQLARKRANDREAQRAIRARTKEHIERLERELEELKSKVSPNATVQDLIRRNRELEAQIQKLQGGYNVHGQDYSPMHDYQSYAPVPENCSSWQPSVELPVASSMSSPTSSSAAEEYGPGYNIPTSVPSSSMPPGLESISSPSVPCLNRRDYVNIKSEYDDLESARAEPSYMLASSSMSMTNGYLPPQQPWTSEVYHPMAYHSSAH